MPGYHTPFQQNALAGLAPPPANAPQDGPINALAEAEQGAALLQPGAAGDSPIRIPLHIQLRMKGIPVANWPQQALDALDPRELAALQESEQQGPGMSLPMRPVDRMIGAQENRPRAPYRNTDPTLMAQAGQQGQDMFNQSAMTRRSQLEEMGNALAPFNPQEELMGGVDGENVRWQEMALGLKSAIQSGQMTQEQAAAELDKHLARSGANGGLNFLQDPQG